jgi:flagellar biosynthesis/type III secretory pathway M-ring protein FliF/YscJ
MKWKIVSKIASVFGIVFIIFAIFAAVVNCELLVVEYGSAAPATFFLYNAIIALLPYATLAILSFVFAWIAIRPERENVSEKMPSAPSEPEPEMQSEEIKP